MTMTMATLPPADAMLLADVIDRAATRCAETFTRVDREARRCGRTIPTPSEKEVVTERLWRIIRLLESSTRFIDSEHQVVSKQALHDQLNPWMLRSRLWARAYLKPHGFAGDFRMIEWMYDLETDPCEDPTQPAIANCLDDAMRSINSVQAVWYRRTWLRQLIERVWETTPGPVRVLDVGCGGSRYCRDFVERHPGQLSLVAVDQDPAAIAFLRSELARSGPEQHLICGSIEHLPDLLRTSQSAGEFDVVISAGLFDSLNDAMAASLLDDLIGLTRPGGTTAICNFSPDDPSRAVNDWINDWHLLYRDEQDMRSLFARSEASVAVTESPDGSLLCAAATRRSLPASRTTS